MSAKLLISALLAAAGVALIEEIAVHQAASARMIGWALVILLAGYHRHWASDDGRVSWGAPRLPSDETTHVVYTMWVLPMANPRKARLSASAKARMRERPMLSRGLEALPVALQSLMLRLLPRG